MSKTAIRNKQTVSQSIPSDALMDPCDELCLPGLPLQFMKEKKMYKNGMFVSRKMLQHASQGGGRGWGARMRKMCLHGPWEIPPLFAITVAFHKKQPPRMRSGGAEESHPTVSLVAEWSGVKESCIWTSGGRNLLTSGATTGSEI